MANVANLEKEILFEGRNKHLVDYIRNNGVNAFIKYALTKRIAIPMVDEAFKCSGITMQPNGNTVYAKAMAFYRNEMSKLGLENLHRGIGMKETIKEVTKYKFRASFLVDANLNLMPEMIIDKNTGLYVPLSRVTNNLYNFYSTNKQPVYQVMCHPGICAVQAAYIVDIQQQNDGNQFYKPDFVEFYQPIRIDPSRGLSTATSGLMTTKVSCTHIENKTLAMLNSTELVRAIRMRVCAEIYPQLLK